MFTISILATKMQYSTDDLLEAAEQFLQLQALMPDYKGFVVVHKNGRFFDMATYTEGMRRLLAPA